ncbi:hypothetical protein [Sphingobacterium sp. HJSM2_6]|uniref:hypothetical protein n=1 Tax=Sphingobacterium sp. HJSM2_6 TaxID=3366264 RepID=UPI003BF4D10E
MPQKVGHFLGHVHLTIYIFLNKDLGNNIFHHNDLITNEENLSSNKYFLCFDKSKKAVLYEFLTYHNGQIIVIDFWAIWCGACMVVSAQIKSVFMKIDLCKWLDISYVFSKTLDQKSQFIQL